MSHYTPSRTLSVRGEIVETFEEGGRKFARIVLKFGCIEVCTEALGECHLGDRVLVDLDITVQGIQHGDAVTGPELATDF